MMKYIFSVFFILIQTNIHAQLNLEYYIEKAKANSPLIYDNLNQSKAAQLDIERLRAFYTKPQIGISATYLFSPIMNLDNNKFQANSEGANKYWGYDFAAANGGQYQALLNISQPLLNGGKLKIAAEQYHLISQINLNNAKISAHDIEKVITDQYILCLQGIRQLDYAQNMMTLLTEQHQMIVKLVESSIYKQSDLTLLNIEKRNFALQLSANKSTYKRDLMDLNTLCGISDTALVFLQEINLNLSGNTSTSLFSEKYKLDSLNVLASQNNFELKYKPQLVAFANTGLNAVYAPTISNRFGMSAGLTFAYNFFDGGQKNINRSKADILLKSVSFYKDNFSNQNAIRKTKALNEIASVVERLDITELQMQDYQVLLTLYKKEILTGQLSIVNYITTLKNMAIVQRDSNILLSQKQQLINTYNYWNW